MRNLTYKIRPVSKCSLPAESYAVCTRIQNHDNTAVSTQNSNTLFDSKEFSVDDIPNSNTLFAKYKEDEDPYEKCWFQFLDIVNKSFDIFRSYGEPSLNKGLNTTQILVNGKHTKMFIQPAYDNSGIQISIAQKFENEIHSARFIISIKNNINVTNINGYNLLNPITIAIQIADDYVLFNNGLNNSVTIIWDANRDLLNRLLLGRY